MANKESFIACLLAGAIGDALGYPIEFMDIHAIKAAYGEQGLSELPVNTKTLPANISDDTQMTMFTADGLLWHCADDKTTCLDAIYKSYMRWYYTQTHRIRNKNWLKKKPHETAGSILDHKELFCRRAPGHTCISSLGSGEVGTLEEPLNNSKGCGGVMRVAPISLLLHSEPEKAFKLACDAAAITHGHPTGYLAAGAFAAIISEIMNGNSLIDSINHSSFILKAFPGHEETLNAINNAAKLADSDIASDIAITTLGEGWIAEEALAIALYCALKEPDFKKAILMSVNHSGDSDSTGSICGNILGAIHGLESIPQEWTKNVELNEYIKTIAIKLFTLNLPGQKGHRL